MDFRPMSPDEIERTLQFLLAQQAQFAADFARLSDKTGRIADALVGLTGIVGRLADAQERTDAQVRETGAQVRETGAQLKETDEHLQVLVDVFERHLREDHGPPPS